VPLTCFRFRYYRSENLSSTAIGKRINSLQAGCNPFKFGWLKTVRDTNPSKGQLTSVDDAWIPCRVRATSVYVLYWRNHPFSDRQTRLLMSSVYCLQVGSKQVYRYCPVKDELFLSELLGPTESNRKNVLMEMSEYQRVDLANAMHKVYEAISRENRSRDGEPPNIKMNIPSLCWAFIVKILQGISDDGIAQALRRASANGNFTDIFALICKVLQVRPQVGNTSWWFCLTHSEYFQASSKAK